MFSKLRSRLAFLRFHMVHRRSRAYIERWQARRLARMISHVRQNVPMYRELYAAIDGTPLTLSAYPVVSKADYMQRPVEEYTDNSSYVDGMWAMTSGTSGQPFTILTRPDFREPYYVESVLYRAFLSSEPWRLINKFRIAQIMTKSPPMWNRLFCKMTEFRKRPDDVVERIARFKPDILESFSSVLYDFATIVERDTLPIHIPYVISGGERMTDGLRTYLQRVLGCEVYSRYGMEEFTVVGMECAEHDGFHTNCESLIVEVVDADGQPVADGDYGRILVTDLYNAAMPYIRYDTGDHGTMSKKTCACGRSSPRVWLEGRYSAWLSFGGKRINSLEYDLALDSFMNAILQYQVVKKSDTEAVVVVIPGIGFSDAVRADIISNMNELLGDRVRISVECVEHMPRTHRGKSMIVRDESGRGIDSLEH